MRIRKLNFAKAKRFDIPDMLVFIKPLGSKLHRVFKLPELDDPDKSIELAQVLNTICTKKHDNVWYFAINNPEDERIVQDTILLMDIQPIMVGLDKDKSYSN